MGYEHGYSGEQNIYLFRVWLLARRMWNHPQESSFHVRSHLMASLFLRSPLIILNTETTNQQVENSLL